MGQARSRWAALALASSLLLAGAEGAVAVPAGGVAAPTVLPSPSATTDPSPSPAAITNIPSLSIQLPPGYTLADLNGSKNDIPADPALEQHSLATIVDPSNAANNLTDVTLESVKSRGNFTWALEKKPYQIKFDTTTPVLGLPTAKTWILLANHADASLLRNKTAYDLAVEFGLPASPDSRFVDLTIGGDYLGNYLLSEKVEVKKNRLVLADPGGLLLELDNSYGLAEDFHFTTSRSNTLFVLKDAVAKVAAPLDAALAESYANTQAYLEEFESLLYAADQDWAAISSMIDVESFIKYHFVQELGANPEITQSSVFFWRDGTNDVLHAGPVWDFDSAFASYTTESLGGDPVQDYIKNAQFLRDGGNGWFGELFRNEEFAALVAKFYEEQLQAKVDAVVAKIDANAAAISSSAEANFERWPNVLGRPSIFSGTRMVADSWQGEVAYLRDWVAEKAGHLAAVYGKDTPVLKYAAHVAEIGWQNAMTSGQIAGTSGRGLQAEALDISLGSSPFPGTIRSRAHVQNIGWSAWQNGNTRLGTTGRSLQLEAVEFTLTDQLATRYDIEYRVHVQNIGWMSWIKNGALAGTTGQSLQIEAIQIRLSEKPANSGSSVSYGAHVANIGWMPEVQDGAVAGTTGRGIAMEALRAQVSSGEYAGNLEYRSHVQNIGWTAWTDSPDFTGTVGQGLRMEAIEIRLTGDLAAHYTIRYAAHVQDIGWQSPVVDGQTSGTTGLAKRMEAIRIELVPKGA
ncbi:CotH kinase family protein [Arthrobacter sp. CJ23]|uniref:CotH kinase family protein n=1 Tax=Arthrobacter sp. CJ23 TaxID=2972479 RepID=UPI00215D0E46|nr:CotH kinase family protein [Arthrobacter sp. CJ23]UVJ39173.1 CotH kinase family protein [Arthrobacter sp. CJ23]